VEIKNLSCWVVSEDLAGTRNQCIAVAEALGVSYKLKPITLREPWKSLSPFLKLEQSWSFRPALTAPYPELVIASGRKSIAAARYIKKASGGKTFTVQIQDPRIDPAQFDLVAVPQHDPTRGNNVIVTDAAPNRVTKERLTEEAKEFPQLSKMKAPRIAVLIGGNSKAYRMNESVTRRLANQLSQLDGSLMLTASRRTGEENIAQLKTALPDAYFYDGTDAKSENPYFAMLEAADFILVTADSTSMISDACSTGKPVYMIPLEGGHPRLDALHNHLIDKGVLRVFDGNLEGYTYEPLSDATKIANAIKERMKL